MKKAKYANNKCQLNPTHNGRNNKSKKYCCAVVISTY